MKKIIIGLAGLLFSIMLCGGIKEITWRFYYARPQTAGYMQIGLPSDIERVSRNWFEEYKNGRLGWKVPYTERIEDAWIDELEVLEPGYVQIEYTVCPSSTNFNLISNLELIETQYRNRYSGQKVLHWEYTNGVWTLTEAMRPVQYQIQSPEFQEELQKPQTLHYAMPTDTPETYAIADGVLYVTYDGGEHMQEVPDGYEKVCKETNETYNELLPAGSYIVSSSFTAFAAYSQEGCSLLYSLDSGVTWEESFVSSGYKAKSFLSKTADACYITFACDRSLGSDYYTTYVTSDYRTWERIVLPQETQSNLTLVYWSETGDGYYSKGNRTVYRIHDDIEGQCLELTYPEAAETADKLGYDPFDTPERMYEENGILYLVVGQGDDGDYAKDGKEIKALYQSSNGSTFTFVKEMEDTVQQAG